MCLNSKLDFPSHFTHASNLQQCVQGDIKPSISVFPTCLKENTSEEIKDKVTAE